VESVCTRAVIIDRGRIVADGTPAALLARSRHHNAVTLTVAAKDGDSIAAKLRGIPGVASVERAAESDGAVTMTAFPTGDALIVETVSAAANFEHWDVKELYAEAGRLDEVFRALTTGDTERARERKMGAAA
jgi:gliding motility-associated transport system ATP-binding protein